ncbi:hypothetical protein Acr_08g0016370 [Actinidia rufa]|uniref:Uncharacterized protein n=1 Tax=Actinidia rufa TaxID=165716 RepID=A0A7J0F3H1_9ERIC|nr:hypothetical protein Acr_08g0016370 [Actinidia rufa]
MNHVMHPMNGVDMWEKSPKPPPFAKLPGRPKKARREPDPPASQHKLKKTCIQMSCRRCGKTRHNKRTCTADMQSPPTTKGKKSTPASQGVRPPSTHGGAQHRPALFSPKVSGSKLSASNLLVPKL